MCSYLNGILWSAKESGGRREERRRLEFRKYPSFRQSKQADQTRFPRPSLPNIFLERERGEIFFGACAGVTSRLDACWPRSGSFLAKKLFSFLV